MINIKDVKVNDVVSLFVYMGNNVMEYLYPTSGVVGHLSVNYAVHKTNQKHLHGYPKAILEEYVEKRSRGYQVDARAAEKLVRVDRAFCLLDGAGIPEGYRSPLVDAIQTSQDGTGETNYFKFKCYRNGNLHIEFKRPDLMNELCRIANGKTLTA